MTRQEQTENIERNRALLREWLKKVGWSWQRGGTQIWWGKHSTHFARYAPRRFGTRVVAYVRFASVDMTQPEIFNERGKLKIKLLSQPKKKPRS